MKIMAIDYGDARTGVAVSDPTATLCGYTTVIHARSSEDIIAALRELIATHGVTELVLGHPINMDGTRGPRAEKAQQFREALSAATALPVTLWDERRTTIDAHNILAANGRNARKRKERVDAVAASLILEGYLRYREKYSEK